MSGALFYVLQVVPNKVLRPSSGPSLKASLPHQLSSLLPARVPLSPLLRPSLARAPQPKPEPQVRALLSGPREVPLKLRGSSPSLSSRNLLLVRNLPVGSSSSRNRPHSLDNSRREDHRRSSQTVPGLQPLSSRDPPPKVRVAQGDAPLCSKSPSPHRSPVRTARLWAALHN